MSGARSAPPKFWTTVRLLLLTARRRAVGRRAYQMKLWRQRSGRKAWSIYQGRWGLVLSIGFSIMIHSYAALLVTGVVSAGERIEAEADGYIVVDHWFIEAVHDLLPQTEPSWALSSGDRARLESYYRYESRRIAEEYGGRADKIAGRLRDAVDEGHGTQLFVDESVAAGLAGLPRGGRLAALLGSVMLVC